MKPRWGDRILTAVCVVLFTGGLAFFLFGLTLL